MAAADKMRVEAEKKVGNNDGAEKKGKAASGKKDKETKKVRAKTCKQMTSKGLFKEGKIWIQRKDCPYLSPCRLGYLRSSRTVLASADMLIKSILRHLQRT